MIKKVRSTLLFKITTTLFPSGLLGLLLMLSGCVVVKNAEENPRLEQSAQQSRPNPKLEFYEGAWDDSVQYAAQARTSTEAEQLADRAMQGGYINKAAALYARAFELDKKNANAGHKLAELHQEAGNSGQAEQIYRFLLKESPRHIASLEGAGLILLKQHNLKEARRLMVKAVAVFQNQTDKERAVQNYIPVRAFNGLGLLADMDGEYSQAQAYYRQGLEFDPESTLLMNNLAYSLYLAGEWKQSEKLLYEVLAITPKYTRAIYNLALVNVRARRYEQAQLLLEKFMEPHEASNDIGYLAMMAGDNDKAEELFQNAIDQAPSYHEAAWKNIDKLKLLKDKPEE